MLKEIEAIRKQNLSAELARSIDYLERFYYQHIGDLAETGTAVLCHTDIHLENILYEGDTLTAIIDLDWAAQAPKDYELWKIMDTFHRPKHVVDATLRSVYGDYQMTDELTWLRKYYSKLFEGDNLGNRVRVYYIDPLIETLVDYFHGLWTTATLDKFAEKVRDFYQNSWLDQALSP